MQGSQPWSVPISTCQSWSVPGPVEDGVSSSVPSQMVCSGHSRPVPVNVNPGLSRSQMVSINLKHLKRKIQRQKDKHNANTLTGIQKYTITTTSKGKNANLAWIQLGRWKWKEKGCSQQTHKLVLTERISYFRRGLCLVERVFHCIFWQTNQCLAIKSVNWHFE